MTSRAATAAPQSGIYKKPGRPSSLRPATSLAELRESRGYTLKAIEAATGINVAVWSQLERGLMVPQPRHLAALTDVFDVPVESWRIRFLLETETSKEPS